MYCNIVSHQCYANNQDTKSYILSYNCPKIGPDQCLSFFYLPQFVYYAAFFPLKATFPNLIATETSVFFLYFSKFANSSFTYLMGRNFFDKLLQNKLLGNLFLWFWPEITKIWSSKYGLDELIAKMTSVIYGLKANRKNKLHIFF